MIRIVNYKLSALKVLLIVTFVLYITFLLIDLSIIEAFISSSMLKYISIVLCFLISLLIGSSYIGKRDKVLLQLGLFITLIADFLLLFTDYFVLGVGVFSIVHIIYDIRYKRNRTKLVLIKFVVVFLIITITYLMLNHFVRKIELLFTVALFYAVYLLSNVVKAIKIHKYKLIPYPNSYFIAWGMVLFLLCDINVVFFNIPRLTSKSSSIVSLLYNISASLIWFFYLPSQMLLSFSGYDFKKLFKK